MPTKEQIALIHIAKSQLRLSDDLYRDILRVQGGVESSKDLDARGVEAVLRRFRELGWRKKRRRELDERPGDLPTPAQLAKIRHLWEDLGWRESERRQGFCRRVCDGNPWPQNREQANRLTEALKAMVLRGYRERKPRRRKTTR
jgi:hypothetical protein